MNQKFIISLEIEMPEDQTEEDAEMWAVSLLETAFKKRNSEPRWDALRGDTLRISDLTWKPEVPVPPSEHPYRPRVLFAKRAA